MTGADGGCHVGHNVNGRGFECPVGKHQTDGGGRCRKEPECLSHGCAERYFHDLYRQTGCYTRIGNWWNRRGESELDMVAINEFDKRAVIAEIKRNSKKLDLAELQRKVSDLPSDFTQYQIELKLLSLEDM